MRYDDSDPMGLNDVCERCDHARKWHGCACEKVVEHNHLGIQWCSCSRFVEPGTKRQQRIAALESELQALKGEK